MPEKQTKEWKPFEWKSVDVPVPGGIPRETLERWISTYFRREENLDEFGMRSSFCLELMAKDESRGYGFVASDHQSGQQRHLGLYGLLGRLKDVCGMSGVQHTLWVDFLFVDPREGVAGYSWSR